MLQLGTVSRPLSEKKETKIETEKKRSQASKIRTKQDSKYLQ